MSSGKKRTGREYDESIPPTKRAKVEVSLHDVWPQKRKLNGKQMGQLPSIMNPSFHKAVFQSFWNKKRFGSPTVAFNELEPTTNRKQKVFKCRMTLVNKRNKSQQIIVTSSDFDSRKKAQINVYQQFNHQYIPFKTLMDKMRPYSFANHVNLHQIVTQKGAFLKSKTKTIIIEPVPLSCNEVDIIQLMRHPHHNSADTIQYIEFERDSDKSIYKRVYVQLKDAQTANQFAQSLNGKLYQKHKLCATWCTERSHSKQFTTESTYLKGVGFPLNISKNRVLQFLYEHKIEPLNLCLICKYSLIPQVFVQFQTSKDCVDALQALRSLKYKRKDNKQYTLYWRYSISSEYNESMDYKQNIKKIHDEVIRRSKCIDVMNISWDTKEHELKRLFAKCGVIEKMHINHRKDLFAGTAFIEFVDEACSEKAILTLNGYNLNGYQLKISMHLKQTREDKKKIKQWYVEQAQEKIQNNKERKAHKAKKKKERAKRKRLRRSLRNLRR